MSQSRTTGHETSATTERNLHWLFADPRCRTTLDVIEDLHPPIDLDALAEHVIRVEPDLAADDEGAIEDVSLALHHSHLPKMDRLGIIEYDPEANRIEARTC